MKPPLKRLAERYSTPANDNLPSKTPEIAPENELQKPIPKPKKREEIPQEEPKAAPAQTKPTIKRSKSVSAKRGKGWANNW
jgi:hypothetical protein